MDTNAVIQVLTQFGFPIVMCGMLCYYILARDKRDKEKDAEHKAETDKLADALNNNTLVMQKLIDKPDKE